MDIPKMENLREIKENMVGDWIVCNWCEWKGLVPYYAERCPNCGKLDSLMFIDDDEKTKAGAVYIPERNC